MAKTYAVIDEPLFNKNYNVRCTYSNAHCSCTQYSSAIQIHNTLSSDFFVGFCMQINNNKNMHVINALSAIKCEECLSVNFTSCYFWAIRNNFIDCNFHIEMIIIIVYNRNHYNTIVSFYLLMNCCILL